MTLANLHRYALVLFLLGHATPALANAPKPLTIKVWLAELQLAPTQAIIDYCRAALPGRAQDLKDARAEYLRISSEAMGRVARKLSRKELDAPAPELSPILGDGLIGQAAAVAD